MPSASKLQTTTFRNRPTLHDFSGRWLITRSDSVNLPKGALVEITPGSGNQASFRMILHQLVGSTTLTGAADFQDGCLNFTYSGNPSSGNNPRPSWFAQATVALVEQEGQSAKFLYGIDIYGDPENAGVWGAEEDGP